jgi:hypothetical protein
MQGEKGDAEKEPNESASLLGFLWYEQHPTWSSKQTAPYGG